MKAVFADIECQGADHEPEQRERQDAGEEADHERRKPEREPDIGAMPQEGPDHSLPPGLVLSDFITPEARPLPFH